jgi:hypothetical protein
MRTATLSPVVTLADTFALGLDLTWVLPTLTLADLLAELRSADTGTLRHAYAEQAWVAYGVAEAMTRSALIMALVTTWAAQAEAA